MIKRTIEISKEPAHLAVKLDQLLIQQRGTTEAIKASVPCEDIGMLLVDQPGVTYSHAALARLMDFGAAVVVCGNNHLPAGILLPLANHTEVVWRINDQMAASKPLCKRLWQQIVIAKIKAQAANLVRESPQARKLITLASEVKSGDPSNVEAQAAKVYWSAWLGDGQNFKRDPEGDGLNGLLNYGYAVVRAAMARALVAAGLIPALGIHHTNRSNPFCLADDLMEPIRPLVDARVRALHQQGKVILDQASKATLLEVLTAQVRAGSPTGPLMVALHRTVASLVRCYQGQEKRLLLPVAIEPQPC